MEREEREEIRYRECFVAFIDLLGFKALVKDSENSPAVITTLVSALNRVATDTPTPTHLTAQHDEKGNLVSNDTSVLQVRPFSDCICLFVPAADGRLPYLLNSIRYIHDRMLELDVCVRGAITIGGMYWDAAWRGNVPPLHKQLRDDQLGTFVQRPPSAGSNGQDDPTVLYRAGASGFPITLGPALVEAHDLERCVAVYPRVIASEGLKQHLETQGSAPAFPLAHRCPSKREAPTNDFFRKDCDGCLFLDLLHPDITRNDTERIVQTRGAHGAFKTECQRNGSTHADVLARVDRLVDSWLSRPDCTSKTRAKYEWLRSYSALVRNQRRGT